MADLYKAEIGEFRRICGGNQQEEDMETCVEIAPVLGVEDAFAIRDSKNPEAGILRFTGNELRAYRLALQLIHMNRTPCLDEAGRGFLT